MKALKVRYTQTSPETFLHTVNDIVNTEIQTGQNTENKYLLGVQLQ